MTVKNEIVHNLKLLEEHGLDTGKLLKIFTKYFDFAYMFTSKVIKDNNAYFNQWRV
ncbi:MAG: hypothetical protein Q9M43_00345 [Sulfurimonas sp.]|nr:hypothetical protein [Sulfurimonas sp.]